MTQVISLRTKRRLRGQDTKANDDLVTKEGRYIGVLPSEDADFMRKWHERLSYEKTQIDELIAAYDEHHTQYLIDLTSVLLYLGFNPDDFNASKERVFISEDGHIWVVPKKEEE